MPFAKFQREAEIAGRDAIAMRDLPFEELLKSMVCFCGSLQLDHSLTTYIESGRRDRCALVRIYEH